MFKGEALELYNFITEYNRNSVVVANNGAPDGKIKETCLAWFEALKVEA